MAPPNRTRRHPAHLTDPSRSTRPRSHQREGCESPPSRALHRPYFIHFARAFRTSGAAVCCASRTAVSEKQHASLSPDTVCGRGTPVNLELPRVKSLVHPQARLAPASPAYLPMIGPAESRAECETSPDSAPSAIPLSVQPQSSAPALGQTPSSAPTLQARPKTTAPSPASTEVDRPAKLRSCPPTSNPR